MIFFYRTFYSDDHGDLPRPLPLIKELKHAIDISDRKETPSWDYDVYFLNDLSSFSCIF